MSNMQLLQHLNDGAIYADPLKPTATCRFKTTSGAKTIDGIRLQNVVTEIIFNDVNPVTSGAKTANDALSVRIRVSGSVESHSRLKALLVSLASQVDEWGTENVLLGFEPTTKPINP